MSILLELVESINLSAYFKQARFPYQTFVKTHGKEYLKKSEL